MADLSARQANARLNPWLIVMALLGLACFAPFWAHNFGWLHSDATQRDAASVLSSGAPLVLLGGTLLFGPRRWPVSRRPKDVIMLALLGLSAASGIIAIVTGAGVLVGVFATLPVSGLVFQSILLVVYIPTLLVRP